MIEIDAKLAAEAFSYTHPASLRKSTAAAEAASLEIAALSAVEPDPMLTAFDHIMIARNVHREVEDMRYRD